MEAELVTELPEGDWQYEPKWDGFRGVMENLKGELAVWSRNARPLLRYFPELREVGELLPPDSALDGEIVIERDGVLDFDAMQMRLHPAESRIRKLSAEIPAEFIAFDVLRWKGEPVHKLPLEKRRAKLERVGKKFRLSPVTRDSAQAGEWLQKLEAAGLDGVVAKRLGVPYLPGSREGVVKVKPYRTADCLIVGFRWSDKAEGRISTLLLGLYDAKGGLDFVGHCSGFPAAVRRELEEKLPKLRAPGAISGERVPGGQSRWTRGKELDWNPVKPKLVCEVRYDKLEKNRFRHGTRFIRWRPDKDPKDCTWREGRPPRRPDEAKRRGGAGVGGGRERLGGSASPVAGVLAVVAEDALAIGDLPRCRRHALIGDAPLHLLRDGLGKPPHRGKRKLRPDRRQNVQAGRAGGLRICRQLEVVEHLLDDERDHQDVLPLIVRRRVEVDQHVVRALDVVHPRVPGVQLDAAEVDHPGKRRRVVDHREDGGVPAGEADELLPDIVGVGRHAFLVEEVALDPVGVALHVKRAPADMVERARRNVDVVLDEVALRQAAPREEELVRVGDLDVVAAESHSRPNLSPPRRSLATPTKRTSGLCPGGRLIPGGEPTKVRLLKR